MLNIIKSENIANINAAALALMAFIKAEKVNIANEFDRNERIKATSYLFHVVRVARGQDQFNTIQMDNEEKKSEFLALVETLTSVLGNKNPLFIGKIKDYSIDKIQSRLAREIGSQLDDLFVLGKVDQNEIEGIYEILGKAVPKKFGIVKLDGKSKKVFAAIKHNISEAAITIKENAIQYYTDMTNKIDPEGNIADEIEFFEAAQKNISDLMTVRLCVMAKFDSENFHKLIDDEFDNTIMFTAIRIADKFKDQIESDVKLECIGLSGKGFDVSMTINEQNVHARAVPVDGSFVRFHYRYIVTC